MIHVEPLQRPISWKGKRYLKGCTQIPEDLAIALGLTAEPEPGQEPDKSVTVANLEAAPTLEAPSQSEEAPPAPKPHTRHKRKSPPKEG